MQATFFFQSRQKFLLLLVTGKVNQWPSQLGWGEDFFFFFFFFPLCILQKQLMEQMEWRNSNDLTVLYSCKFCCCSVVQSCPTSCDPVDCSTPGFPVLHQLEFAQTHSTESVMPSNHLICCCPLLLLSSIFPSIRVFSNVLAPCIRWPTYWSLLQINPTT